jgi:hypothetical protein
LCYGEYTFRNGERQAWWDVQNVDLILLDSLFNLASSGTSIRDWSLNKGKPGAAGHIVGQYRSKKICCTYIRSGGSNRYCGKTQTVIFMKKVL